MNKKVVKIALVMLLCVICAGIIPAWAASSSKRPSSGKNSKVCSVCKGKKQCTLCKGSGLSGQVINLGWSKQYLPCLLCGGKKICMSCNGTGRRDVELSILETSGSYNHHSSGSHSNHNNSGRHGNRQCSSCGGTGLRASVAYENDPYGASVAISYGTVGYVNKDGTRCRRCGRYSYHVHYKCTDCNNR